MDRTRWEFWLHKCHGISYGDYLQKLKEEQERSKPLPAEEIRDIVARSCSILSNFHPEEGEEHDA